MTQQIQQTIEALIQDKEVERVKIIVTLKPGVEKVSSMVVHRAALQWLAENLPSWTDYCIANSMKTLN